MKPASDQYMTKGERAEALTRAELSIVRSLEAFSRWSHFLHKNVSKAPLSAHDVWLLHAIRMCGGAQSLSELLLFLNRNDVSTLQYSLKKIEQCGLIERIVGNSKREAGYRLTDAGIEATDAYAEIRSEILLKLISEVNGLVDALPAVAEALERLTGIYDQSTQAVLNRRIMTNARAPSE